MVRLGELMTILELHRQGLAITAIARRTGRDPKTIRKYIERGVEAPAYGPRSVGRPCKLAPFRDFLREWVTALPDLSAARLTREIRALSYGGAYTAVKRYLATIRPENGPKPYEVRFETPAGLQTQVDFARFVVDFADDPARMLLSISMASGSAPSTRSSTPTRARPMASADPSPGRWKRRQRGRPRHRSASGRCRLPPRARASHLETNFWWRLGCAAARPPGSGCGRRWPLAEIPCRCVLGQVAIVE